MRLLSLALFILLFVSCNNVGNKPDVSDIKVNINLERFEKDFFNIDTTNLLSGLTNLNKKYPRFYPLFANDILLMNQDHIINGQGEIGLTPDGEEIFRSFIRWYRPINDSIQIKYKDLDWLKDDIEEGFKYVKHYYPNYNVPGIITFIGSFDAPGIVLTPKYLGIGLHQYAGRNFSAYKDPGIMQMYPEYISKRFDREYMVPNCFKAVVDDIYPDTTESGKLIELMIEKGKQWFLLDKFLPDAPDSLITGYTKAQSEWVVDQEGNIWGSILQNTSDLYTMDLERVQNYIGESPRTLDMPDQSPGNIGQWVGWQIVKKYAEKNPGMTIQQILASPANKIFQEAKYKPK
jgi:hypothetical protein